MNPMTTPTVETPQHAAPSRRGDKIFKGLATGAGIIILLALAGVAIFLTYEGYPALTTPTSHMPNQETFVAYVWPLIFGTLLAAALAILIATPLAIGVALFISHYCPRRIATSVGYVVDLLAAVPSVVYGLWGIFYLAPRLVPLYGW